MFLSERPAFVWNPSHEKVLKSRDFVNAPPGTILRDFASLLELMQPTGLPLTPKHLFAMNTLETINQRLTRPVDLRLKRPGQKSYPNINGLYLVLRSTGLTLIELRGKKPFLVLDPEMVDRWNGLNATEAYFALLRAWWAEADETIVDKHSWQDTFAKCTSFLGHFKRHGPECLQRPRELESLSYLPSLHNLALLELFGLLEIELAASAEAQAWQPVAMRITPWGDALMAHFESFLHGSPESTSEVVDAEPEIGDLFRPSERFDVWARSLRSNFEDWQRELEIPSPPLQPGRHVFRVSLKRDCWRRIAISGEAGFDELASAILAAFDFDEDHLYAFQFEDRLGRSAQILHASMYDEFDGELADEIKVGELGLIDGARMVFIFDFGDNWRFELVVEQLGGGPAPLVPQVLDIQGEAPPQYDDTW